MKIPFRFELHNEYVSPLKESSFKNFIHPDLHYLFLSFPVYFVFTYFEIMDRALNLIKMKKREDRGYLVRLIQSFYHTVPNHPSDTYIPVHPCSWHRQRKHGNVC